MRTAFTAAAVAMVIFLTLPGNSLAAGNDTLVVYANGPSLDAVINADTTSSGSQAHSVYKLVSLDTTYIYLGPIRVKSNITMIGVVGPDNRPPCIQPGVLKNGSSPYTLISMPIKGTTGRFENLYILELNTRGSSGGGLTFVVSADSVKLYLDNVIDDENPYMVVQYSGSWDDFFIKNCKIINGVNATGDWYASDFLLWNLYLPANPVDSVVMDYNTFFCMNGGPGGIAYAKYVEFSHNTVGLSFFGQPPGVFGSGKIDNNIFYGVESGGNSKSEFTWEDDPFRPEVSSVIDYDTMSVVNDSLFDPADVGKTNWRMLAEAKRNVEVENNVYFMPKAITDFQTAWDDTAHADSLYTPGWMNARTTNMFNDKTDWPGFKSSGNLVGTDPGYGTSLVNVLDGGTGYGVGLLQYITKARTGTLTTEEWGYQKTQVGSAANWVPTWPLAEQTSGVLKYSASLTAPDGKPYGDPYWFTLEPTAVKQQPPSIPVKFDLSQNYPNPFNPSTTIKVTLAKSGVMSLSVYNVLGELVKVVDQGYKAPGVYTFDVNMNDFASGVYFYRLQQGTNLMTKKMLLLK